MHFFIYLFFWASKWKHLRHPAGGSAVPVQERFVRAQKLGQNESFRKCVSVKVNRPAVDSGEPRTFKVLTALPVAAAAGMFVTRGRKHVFMSYLLIETPRGPQTGTNINTSDSEDTEVRIATHLCWYWIATETFTARTGFGPSAESSKRKTLLLFFWSDQNTNSQKLGVNIAPGVMPRMQKRSRSAKINQTVLLWCLWKRAAAQMDLHLSPRSH